MHFDSLTYPAPSYDPGYASDYFVHEIAILHSVKYFL